MSNKEIKILALFDFDKTIISKDTGTHYVLFALKKNCWRFVFGLLLFPIAGLFFLFYNTRYIGNSIYFWITTVGLSVNEIKELRESFIDYYLNRPEVIIYNDAFDKIKSHCEQGHQVYIISGASQWMVEKIIEKTDLTEVFILGSDEQRFFGGMVSKFHCFAQNKITALNEVLDLKSYTKVIGYSDSSSDIPLLSICHRRYAVNPNRRSLKKFNKAFKADIKMLDWV